MNHLHKRFAGTEHLLISLFIVQICCAQPGAVLGQQTAQAEVERRSAAMEAHVPRPLAAASHISLDGLTLVIVFSRPVNLSLFIESVEQRLAAAAAADQDDESATGAAESSSLRSSQSAPLEASPLTSIRSDNNNSKQQSEPSSRSASSSSSASLAKTKKESKANVRMRPVKVRYSSSRDRSAPLKSANEAQGSRMALLQMAASGEGANGSAAVCRLDGSEEESGLWDAREGRLTAHLIGGIQLCAQLLTRKTLRLLRKFRVHNCLWPSQNQFLIRLGKPIGAPNSANSGQPTAASVKIAFRRGTLSAQGEHGPRSEQDTAVELSRRPLEALGLPLAPRLALTGPNQVPVCGQFSLSAHLWSPFGTQPDDSLRLEWSVERVGVPAAGANQSVGSMANMSLVGDALPAQGRRQSAEATETQWRALQQVVAANRANNLVLDAQLLQFAPQLYEFRLQATFAAGLQSFTLNATHQLARLDFDAPIGTLYGSHLLAAEQQLNTNQELALLAHIEVPECAANVKQVGLYWQVSDPRVRFEQTYAPLYVAKRNTLPEQALIEFRLNLFYGIRVKKVASARALLATGDSLLEAQISDGLLMASVGQPQLDGAGLQADRSATSNSRPTSDHADKRQQPRQQQNQPNDNQLELFAISRLEPADKQADRFAYQWSCFDGKTAQPCQKSLGVQASSGGTRYEVGQASQQLAPLLGRPQAPDAGGHTSSLLLVERARQHQPVLRLPLSWFEPEARLWFGLQRFERHKPGQHSKSEYALVEVYAARGALAPPTVSIGPVLVGSARQRATLRNPLTGAIVLLERTPVVIVGRVGASNASLLWRVPNYSQPLHWTSRQVENPLSRQPELLTELHLNGEFLLAHAHHQVQLTVCSAERASSSAGSSLASISLDIVEGVSQCRVEPLARPPAPAPAALVSLAGSGSGNRQQQPASTPVSPASNWPLVITVNRCNIPLALSPITYQLYVVDTSAADSFIEASRTPSEPSEADDYTNEADELQFESQAQPLSVPQLSPVFSLGALDAWALTALAGPPQDDHSAASSGAAVRLRFGARVCNRLQSCKMFYSASIDPVGLLAANPLAELSAGGQNQSVAASLLAGSPAPPISERLQASTGQTAAQQLSLGKDRAIGALRNMLESAKRANVAGNSIAAISILNAVMALGQRLLEQAAAAGRSQRPVAASQGRQNYRQHEAGAEHESGAELDQAGQGAESNNAAAGRARQARAEVLSGQQLHQLQQLLQLAMRDCLQYGAQSVQRQFHYTESGQSNLVLLAASRMLTLTIARPHQQLELKYGAMRLISTLLRKSIERGLDERPLASLPDLKSIQTAFESLFSSFGQHSIDSLSAAQPLLDRRRAKRHDWWPSEERIDAATSRKADDTSNRWASRQVSNSNTADQLMAPREIAQRRAVVHPQEGLFQEAGRPQEEQRRPSTGDAGRAIESLAPAASSLAAGLKPSASRRAKEEAMLAYLRLVRHAHRALLQATAAQLALGAVQQLEYQSSGSPLAQLSPSGALANEPAPVATAPLVAPASDSIAASPAASSAQQQQQQQQATASAKFVWAQEPAAHVVSALTHQTDLLSDTIDLDLQQFGSVSVRFVAPQDALRRLGRALSRSHARCRNESAAQTKCSSFVLALTSFAGKAPFRSLDSSRAVGGARPRKPSRAAPAPAATPLRVPVIQIDWLSPLDGSSLVELLRGQRDGPPLADFKASVTFTLPPAQDQQALPTASPERDSAKFKCYQFDEASNEWREIEQRAPPGGQPDGPEASERAPPAEQRISCPFDGFGVLSAFQGGPPAPETPSELRIVLGVACCLAVVTIFSLLGCIASRSRAKRQRALDSHSSPASSTSSYQDEFDQGASVRSRQTVR